ncbi:MAG TPA: hypothetical protein VE864_05180 [Streptosporangiaceae bacterium]|nr:hypothetical protein [Streptosporangiaceae bacterium]
MAVRTATVTSSALAASPDRNTARPCRAVIASATRWPPARSWSRRTRAAPCAANRSAPAAPTPLAAPVMIPTRPRSRWSPGASRPMTMASASFGALAQMMIIRSAEY